jgi:hypothetical protein
MSTNPDSITATELDPACWPEECGDTLFRYALARLRNTTHAKVMVQETLMAALYSWRWNCASAASSPSARTSAMRLQTHPAPNRPMPVCGFSRPPR